MKQRFNPDHEIEHEIVFLDTKRLKRREKMALVTPLVAILPIAAAIAGLVLL